MIRTPVSRDLTRPELRRFVGDLVTRPELWQDLIRHDPSERVYEQLLRDEHLAVWLICWMDDHDTGFHDHDVSNGALAVARGQVREERLGLGTASGAAIDRVIGTGDAIDFSAADIHRVTHAGSGPAVTINAYSPPLWRMGAYEVKSGTGELQRHSVSYAEELRPIGA